MDAFSMGLVAAMGALATIGGASEDIESDIGSQSNPNSQVQLAAQVGNPHRIYNKAISGEPPANALYAATAAIVGCLQQALTSAEALARRGSISGYIWIL
jgi:tetrahydromethanopterin S-methyltransferase subunit E